MYKHFLVPLDNTPLGAELVGDAIDLARMLSARVTFLHITGAEDASFYGDAALVRASDPERFQETYRWAARAVLARAEAGARAVGIAHSVASLASDATLHEAILQAAHEHGCDLVVMGSHERSSRLARLMNSTAMAVATRTTIPFLLAIPGAGGAAPMRHAIARIRDEHRTIAAVVEGLRRIAAAKADPLTDDDKRIALGAVRFLGDFAGRQHHPKEEDYIFGKLRMRCADMQGELSLLEQQHTTEGSLLAEVQRSLEGAAVAGHGSELSQRIEALAKHVWGHMGKEEEVILPLARAHLDEEEWREIDAAFAGDTDPRFGADDEKQLRSMYTRLANMLPT